MSKLLESLNEYLALRRKLGFLLVGNEAELKEFVRFLELVGAQHITVTLALQWAQLSRKASRTRHSIRLGMARDFARYMSAADPRTEIPPPDLLRVRRRRPHPHIYTQDQVVALVRGAATLKPVEGLRLRPHTYFTLFGLIAATGMRASETVNLECRDVDLERGIITVRESKHRKTRFLPLHQSTLEKLCDYADRRDRCIRSTPSASFFISDRRKRLQYISVDDNFLLISHRIGLRPADALRGPRIHDLRHTFAVRVLTEWYRSGGDPARCLPLLATYLGHSHITDTYWYLSATPELLGAANSRLESFMGGQS